MGVAARVLTRTGEELQVEARRYCPLRSNALILPSMFLSFVPNGWNDYIVIGIDTDVKIKREGGSPRAVGTKSEGGAATPVVNCCSVLPVYCTGGTDISP